MDIVRISLLSVLLVAILHGASVLAEEETTTQRPTTNSQSPTATPTGVPAKLETKEDPKPRADVSEVEVELPSRPIKERPDRLERMDDDFFGMSPYGMNNMPMHHRNYFYPHMMAPTLPPFEDHRPTQDRNAGKRKVPHPRQVAPPPSSIRTEINTIPGDTNPNFEYEERSRPFVFTRHSSPRKKSPQMYESIYFDDESSRRPYPYGVRSRPRERSDSHFKPSFFQMPNGHSEAFETEPIPEDSVFKPRQRDAYGKDENRYGLWQSDKKTYRAEKLKALRVPEIHATREQHRQLTEEEATTEGARDAPQIEEGYQPPYRSFVLGPAGYQLVTEVDSSSASTPSRIEHVPLVGESRRRLITYMGAKEYFGDETDYIPSGGFKPLVDRGSNDGVKQEAKKEE